MDGLVETTDPPHPLHASAVVGRGGGGRGSSRMIRCPPDTRPEPTAPFEGFGRQVDRGALGRDDGLRRITQQVRGHGQG